MKVSVMCPVCERGTIEVDVTHFRPAQDPGRRAPPQPAELDWDPYLSCENCFSPGHSFRLETESDLMYRRILEAISEQPPEPHIRSMVERYEDQYSIQAEQARIQRDLKR